jgi:hypothetical protein
LPRGAVQAWSDAPLDETLLATIGTCVGALRGQLMYLLDEEQADDSPLDEDDTLTLDLPNRRVEEWDL